MIDDAVYIVLCISIPVLYNNAIKNKMKIDRPTRECIYICVSKEK